MVEAFVYMYVVSFGSALGVASVVLLSWKFYKRMNNKSMKKRKGAIV